MRIFGLPPLIRLWRALPGSLGIAFALSALPGHAKGEDTPIQFTFQLLALADSHIPLNYAETEGEIREVIAPASRFSPPYLYRGNSTIRFRSPDGTRETTMRHGEEAILRHFLVFVHDGSLERGKAGNIVLKPVDFTDMPTAPGLFGFNLFNETLAAQIGGERLYWEPGQMRRIETELDAKQSVKVFLARERRGQYEVVYEAPFFIGRDRSAFLVFYPHIAEETRLRVRKLVFDPGTLRAPTPEKENR